MTHTLAVPAPQDRVVRPPERRPYARGYRAPAALRGVLRDAHRTRLGVSVLMAGWDHVSVPLAALAAAWPGWWSGGGGRAAAGVLVVLAAALLVGRQLRALECLVHEASHFNWCRHHRRANDLCAGLLAGLPTGIRIARYRADHLLHHSRLGTDDDPDLRRYAELDLAGLDRGSRLAYTRSMLVRLAAHQRSWYRTTSTDLPGLLLPPLWALAVVAVPGWLLWGAGPAATAGAVWLAGHAAALPVLRFIGESSEHSYHDADTVFDSTVTNLGAVQRWLIHPHSDGYHTVHHLWPGTPHHRLRLLHEELSAADPDGYRRRLRARHRVLDAPTPVHVRTTDTEE
ncbi:hypothetical protein E2C00_31295 [Streptomyces sp. WAC05374]|uniref:fatty acid desaturase n=1 Tax=Streptomyces sp. WAC05374 TaxID=2487420 RepID=UPI000F88A519|nr:fatty acid desaturase [Streptomyces sp. WAC05374]RST18335.1 hypothetical protein EF905_05800 [Streptomyces sp. WAC05374]TDF39106.1 hypothetical protein E2B92_26700 [Streptomyces sp. WAC05374]TDF47471.1 hypothetical protein E2C02_30460 [Streptomyces sp. WAC05374]TDF48214.1 hypothetical protein E2C00_31295 [Streptomyces sp. WAC05374]